MPVDNPPGTPSVRDLKAWKGILAAGKADSYAANTLLDVLDVALSSTNQTSLEERLFSVIWNAGTDCMVSIINGCGLSSANADPVRHRGEDVLIAAIKNTHRPDGTINPNHANIRLDFYRFVRNRATIDILRSETRLAAQVARTQARAKAYAASITKAKKAYRKVTGRDLDGSTIYADKKTSTMIKLLLEGKSWKEVADGAVIASADAAQKRFRRLVERLTEGRLS